jgi:hypothetical protein
MDNVVILTSSDSDSDFSDESGGHSDREEEIYESEHFMNHINKKQYEINRNKFYTKDIEEIDIIIDSNNKHSKNNYKYNLCNNNTSNTGEFGKFKNVIGISLLKFCLISNSDTNPHFVDVIIPEIPYKACIHNSHRDNLLARLCIENNSSNQMIVYEPENIKDNYFFPISLSEFTIKLYNSFTRTIYNTTMDNSLILRLTILNNTQLFQ